MRKQERTEILSECSLSDRQVRVVSGGQCVFEDDHEHYDQGFKRLLDLSEWQASEFFAYVTRVAADRGESPDLRSWDVDDAISLLKRAWGQFRGPDKVIRLRSRPHRLIGERSFTADRVWAGAIGDDTSTIMIGTASPPHAWLVDRRSLIPLAAGTTDYEGGYFEGSAPRLGYAGYESQAGWRIEKAKRQVQQVESILRLVGGLQGTDLRVLDLGSGYGYFRAALAEKGWSHAGLDVSQHAADAALRLYGFSTHVGTLDQLVGDISERYDAIAMWDFLEHVDDPGSALRQVSRLLADDGFIFLRTPNLLAAERQVFGSRYHSFKREHLHMFSPASLSRVMLDAGFLPTFMSSESHLLRGFLGGGVECLATELRGSDLLAAGRAVR